MCDVRNNKFLNNAVRFILRRTLLQLFYSPYAYLTGNIFIVESIKFWTFSEIVLSFEAQNSLPDQ
jgi:hypothetical protein